MEVFFKKHFWVFNLVVISVFAAFSARAASHLLAGAYLPAAERPKVAVKPIAQATPPRQKDDLEILKRNIFCSTCPPIIVQPSSGEGGGPIENTGPQRTTMPLRLVLTW